MKTILIIDDEPMFIEMMGTALPKDKYKVESALNGEEGLKKIEELKPDAVLLDIRMPGMNGIEVLKKIDTKKLPVLITSNESGGEAISEGVALGARGYIVKSEELPHSIVGMVDNLFK